MTEDERQEFENAWNDWCWDTAPLSMTPCTLPKNHKGGHVCKFADLMRYEELRRKVGAPERTPRVPS